MIVACVADTRRNLARSALPAEPVEANTHFSPERRCSSCFGPACNRPPDSAWDEYLSDAGIPTLRHFSLSCLFLVAADIARGNK